MDRLCHPKGSLRLRLLYALPLVVLLFCSQVPTAHGLDCPICYQMEHTRTHCPIRPCNSLQDWKAAAGQLIESEKPYLRESLRKDLEARDVAPTEEQIDEIFMAVLPQLLDEASAPEPDDISPPQYACLNSKIWKTSTPEDGTPPSATINNCFKVKTELYPRTEPYTNTSSPEQGLGILPNSGTKVEKRICNDTVGLGPECGPEAGSGVPTGSHLVLIVGVGFIWTIWNIWD